MKIIILALSGLGDAIMFSPALRILKQTIPMANVDMLTMFKAVNDVYENNPDISKIHLWDFLKRNPIATLHFLFSLRKLQYDASIIVFPANRFPYNIISRFIGAKRRLAHTYNHANIRSLHFLNTDTVHEDDNLHNVEENLRLISLLNGNNTDTAPALQIFVDGNESQFADEWIKKNNAENSLLIGFHAGSAVFKNQINKRWDKNKFAILANKLSEQYQAKVLVFGGPEELELNTFIAENSSATIVSIPSLKKSIAIMQRCKLFVSNDSGLMHTAAALGIPVVGIFGYTSHIHTRPWSEISTVVRTGIACSPCFYFSPKPAECSVYSGDKKFLCMKEITVDMVEVECKKLLARMANI